MGRERGSFITNDSLGVRLFNVLPVYPEPAISKKELAKILKIDCSRCNNIISTLPANEQVYEDFGEIGRIK